MNVTSKRTHKDASNVSQVPMKQFRPNRRLRGYKTILVRRAEIAPPTMVQPLFLSISAFDLPAQASRLSRKAGQGIDGNRAGVVLADRAHGEEMIVRREAFENQFAGG